MSAKKGRVRWMLKGRRVGTLTSGIVLIMLGIAYLLKLVFPAVKLSVIASMWPLILIFLGVEMLLSYVVNKEEKMKYDFGAIFLIIVLTFFAMGMGGTEFVLNHLVQFRNAGTF